MSARPVPTALCPRCMVPLICTLAFYKAEFYCLDCGGEFGWLQPRKGDAEAHAADLAAREAEWEEHAGHRLIVPRSWLRACALCDHSLTAPEYHADHATEEEWEADRVARAWIALRRLR